MIKNESKVIRAESLKRISYFVTYGDDLTKFSMGIQRIGEMHFYCSSRDTVVINCLDVLAKLGHRAVDWRYYAHSSMVISTTNLHVGDAYSYANSENHEFFLRKLQIFPSLQKRCFRGFVT